MKIGPRKPSIKKSISARTTGKGKKSCEKSCDSWLWKERLWMD